MIAEVLRAGQQEPLRGRELAQYFKCTIREITAQIEQERRAGAPICATTGRDPGYYLAADIDELEHYCRRLTHRGREMLQTGRAMLDSWKRGHR